MDETDNALHVQPPLGHTNWHDPTRETASGSNTLERGESTPTSFAPDHPTDEDPEWPQVLALCMSRLISTVRDTSICAHSTPSSLPGTIAEPTNPMRTERVGSTPDLSVTDREEGRPANRDTHQSHINGTDPDTSMRARGTHNSEQHCPGDLEMPPPTKTFNKVLPPDGHSNRQSLSPPTARPHAHPSSPPDEDGKPKRVADSERYHSSTHESPPVINHDNDHQTNCPHRTTAKANGTSAVPPLNSSTVSGLITEHEGSTNPRPIAPEEAMSTPVHPQANRLPIALAKSRSLLDKMCSDLITKFNKIKNIELHQYNVQHNITKSEALETVQSFVDTMDNKLPGEIDIAEIAITPLLQCVNRHYERIIKTQYQLMKENINKTHHSLMTENTVTIIKHTINHTIEEAIQSLTHYLRCKTPKHHTDAARTTCKIHTTTSHSKNNEQTTNPPRNNAHHNRPSKKDRLKKQVTTHSPNDCINPNCFQCASNNIVNMSKVQLTKTQILLLNKGLSFVPTTTNAEPMEIMKDFNAFTIKTKNKLRRMVNPPRPPKPNEEPTLFRKPTINSYHTNPQSLGPKALEDAFEAMRMEITKLDKHPTLNYNLTRKERQAMRELSTDHNLVINKADKGSTIVVRHRTDYIKEGLEHLSDTNTYVRLDRDYTPDITKIVKDTLQQLKTKGSLSPRMADYCLPPSTVRTAQIYFLKKIHKNPMGIRPIVSTVNSATANLAEFLDFYLQPIMKKLPAYLKDTTQFLCEIADIPIEKDTWLVTIDVKSLYTNIPNDQGIQACYRAWLKQESTDPQHPPAEVLRHLLEVVLKLNTFEFNEKHYLQQFGTAMGSKLAPAYVNTFMGDLEKSILENSPLKPTYYRRFIDDIFLIWPHSEIELMKFITYMNTVNTSIQFTHEKNQQEVVFLDVVVYKHHGTTDDEQPWTLNTKTHIKPTNKQLYVREDSYHPPARERESQ